MICALLTRRITICVILCLTLLGCSSRFLTYVLPSRSMEPTIPHNSLITVDTFAYKNKLSSRWDIIAFHYPLSTNSVFAMRVAGLPGERIFVSDGKLYINNTITHLPDNLTNVVYKTHKNQKYANLSPFLIPRGHVFILGDNSDTANDSRFWGPLSKNLIVGKVLSWKVAKLLGTGL